MVLAVGRQFRRANSRLIRELRGLNDARNPKRGREWYCREDCPLYNRSRVIERAIRRDMFVDFEHLDDAPAIKPVRVEAPDRPVSLAEIDQLDWLGQRVGHSFVML